MNRNLVYIFLTGLVLGVLAGVLAERNSNTTTDVAPVTSEVAPVVTGTAIIESDL